MKETKTSILVVTLDLHHRHHHLLLLLLLGKKLSMQELTVESEFIRR